jgi:hypothetical protein
MRASLTTEQGKAKCLAYRNGKRCGRVAKIVGITRDFAGYHKTAMCVECADRLDAEVVEKSSKGFTVHYPPFGPRFREYRRIE